MKASKPVDITEGTLAAGGFHILYGREQLRNLGVDPEQLWRRAAACGGGERGGAAFFRIGGCELAYKRYHRGGLPGRFVRSSYLYLGRRRVRSFAEWRALRHALGLGLPVPVPVSARYRRRGLACTAELVTMSLRPARTLADCLADGGLPAALWRGVGAVARDFADRGLGHADLNARNVLVDGQSGALFVVDLDRARVGLAPGGGRADGDRAVRRLRRSLDKLAGQGVLAYSAGDWDALVAGYEGG